MSVLRMRRLLAALAAVALLSVAYYSVQVNVLSGGGRPVEYEQRSRSAIGADGARYHYLPGDIHVRVKTAPVVVANKTLERRVLIMTSGIVPSPGTERRPSLQEVASAAQSALQHAKYSFEVMRGGPAAILPYMEDETRAFYAVVVFEDREAYASLPEVVREQLEIYCRKYDVGVVVLVSSGMPSPPAASATLAEAPRSGGQPPAPFGGLLPLHYSTGVDGHNYSLHPVPLLPSLQPLPSAPLAASPGQQQPLATQPTPPAQPLYRLVRSDTVQRGSVQLPSLPTSGWTTFHELHQSYVVVATVCAPSFFSQQPSGSSDFAVASNRTNMTQSGCGQDDEDVRPVIVLDPGTFDGVRRVFFGYRLNFWLHRALFLDTLSYLTHGLLELPLDRFIQIDIDDIFVGEVGTKLQADDVEELVKTQERWRTQYIPRFTFYLGFSGLFFGSGNEGDRQGDELLIEVKDKFSWFCHTWSHAQPHTFDNETHLVEQINLNWQFAQEKGLPVDTTYSVAPHHSGVYPIHDPLYSAWKSALNVQVTSTEEYPHLYPARLRRGFIYRDIKVIPRQVCGVYTKTLFYDLYPGGPQRLEAMINGGEIFDSFLYNPVNVFMTHQQNYGNADRLAVYMFDKAFAFMRHYTNVVLRWAPPVQLAALYFELYPEERWPVWTNPCLDKRHMEIWGAARKSPCQSLPAFIIAGPQKTGTTALSSFLQLHPDISSSHPDPITFEEVHFFGTANYYNGLDWYLSFFDYARPSVTKEEDATADRPPTLYFDKSANYFDSAIAPLQVRALLPSAKIIIILLNPIDRAFSWYHHQKAHGDPVATSYEFYDVIAAKANASKELLQLQARCIVPGFYASHIENWRKQFPDKQIMVVDGHELKQEPANVMHSIQKFLQVTQVYDYSIALVYDPKKQFYCVKSSRGPQCLGASKGRSRYYGPVDMNSALLLQNVYLEPNRNLKKLLDEMGYDSPAWLQEVT